MADKKISELDAVGTAARTDEFVVVQSGTTKRAALSDIDAVAEIGASQVTAGTLADARVAESNVTQHEAALSVAGSQVDSGTLPDARIQESGVTQHGTAALEVSWSNTVVVEGDNSTRTTRATEVQAAITEAAAASKSFVFVPQSFLNYDASAVTFDNSVRMVREGQVSEGYDVKAYGAAGDGTTDDTSGVDAALAQAASAASPTVYFPAGQYLYSTELTLPTTTNGVTLEGANWHAELVGTGTGVLIQTADRDTTIRNLRIRGDVSGGTPTVGVLIEAPFAVVSNCKIEGFSADGIRWRETHSSVIEKCWIVSNTGVGVRYDVGATFGVNASTIRDCLIDNNGSYGIRVDSTGGGLTVRQCSILESTIQGNTNAGIRITSNVEGLRIEGCWFESNASAGAAWEDIVVTAASIKNFALVSNLFAYDVGTAAQSVNINPSSSGARVFVENNQWTSTNPTFDLVVDAVVEDVKVGENDWANASPELQGDNFRTFADGDATPDVRQGSSFKTANTGATTITGLDRGWAGKKVIVVIDDNNTTIDFTGTNLKGNSGVDWTPATGDHMTCVYDGTNWYCDISDNTA